MIGGIKVGAGPGQGQACLEADEWNRDHDLELKQEIKG